jgi:tRNA G18 (ribose-2'-O)-methylase SpoU
MSGEGSFFCLLQIRIFAADKNQGMRKLKVTELRRLSLAQYKDSPKLPLVVVLDNVRSLYNIGSVFRTCDAFRVEALCLCGITACPPHPEIHKTALGAEDAVDWTYFQHTAEALQTLKSNGYILCAVEQAQGSAMLHTFMPGKENKYALIFGNEVKGVQQTVVDLCDHCLEIPQYGTKHSLNVSVSAGIVLWDLFTKLD